MKGFLIIAAASLVATTNSANEETEKRELEKLQGTWAQISAEGEGKKLVPEEKDRARLVFAVDKWSITFPGRDFSFGGVLKLDPTKNPKVLKMSFTAEGPLKGHIAQAIYRLEADTLTICQIGKGQQLPNDFKPGAKQTVSIYKRQKP